MDDSNFNAMASEIEGLSGIDCTKSARSHSGRKTEKISSKSSIIRKDDGMTYDFDAPIDRHGTDCIKYDRPELRGHSADLLPFWVADMDFTTPTEVVEAICKRAEHGIFGYTDPGPEYFAAIDRWCSRRYGWHVPAEQVVATPGVVFALAAAVRAFTAPGDAIVVQQPVYYPFSSVVEANSRKLAVSQLAYDGARYTIDFDGLERVIVDRDAKMLLLCNPHNPVGRAWSAEELERVCDICARHNAIVVSDEIHMDFARPGHEHVPFAQVGDERGCTYIAATSASKTFNLAGLQTANVVIPDEDLRAVYRATLLASGYSQPNTLGAVATQAAYEHGEPWLRALKDYLEGNWKLLADTLAERAPGLRLVEAESTYLAWIDCKALGYDAASLERFIEDEAGLWLDCGDVFGAGGDGFVRINIATQRAYLERGIDQLCSAAGKVLARPM